MESNQTLLCRCPLLVITQNSSGKSKNINFPQLKSLQFLSSSSSILFLSPVISSSVRNNHHHPLKLACLLAFSIMAETPIRFGVLGCADIARKVSRAINLAPNASLYAVASRTLDKAQKFAVDNGFPPPAKIYGSYEALLDDPDVDAVYLPLPTSLHVRWAVLVAEKKKHVLLEKPVALNVQEFDRIVAACDLNGVQFMDGTMWMHHPRTAMMREILSDSLRFGQLKSVHSFFSFAANPDFLKNDIRVKPDLDGLGALGDVGWYCIRSILWVVDYELPKAVTALRGPVFNESGVILSCGASLHWEDGKVATFQCSFITNLTMDITAVGTKGTLHLNDFVIPFEETSASFTLASESGFTDLVTGWNPMPSEHVVTTDLPQEACMVMEFASLVRSIKESGSKPENKWPVISRKTQLVLDAVKASIDKGFMPIEIDYSIKLDELNSQFVVSNTCNGEGGEAGVHEWVGIDGLNSPHLNISNSGVDEMNSLAVVSEMGVEEMKQPLVELNTGGDTEEEHRTDVSEHFTTDLVFESRQHLLDWCQDIGRRIKLAVVIRKSEKPAPRRSGRLVLGCERSGRYRKNPLKKDKTDKDYRETGTKKCNCPFQLKGIPLPVDKWKVEVVCGYHNHPITESLVWHSSAGRLNREEEEFVIDLLKSGVKARDVLVELKQRSETNVSNLKTIYNARNRLRLLGMEGSSAIKELDMEESSNSVKPACRRRKYKSRRKDVTSTICSS